MTIYTRFAAPQAGVVEDGSRVVRYMFSTPEVARDRHTIAAWDLVNFRKNNIFLWCHDSKSPPIGKVVDLADNRGVLTGSVQYAERDEYEFADTIYKLVRGGYINATSVSWNPLEWSWSKDRSRPGGIDFALAELLEVSQVPVPALPNALATARAAGIDTGPLYQWAEQVLDSGGMLLVPRAEIEALRREAKMPSGSWKSRAEAADKARREVSGWKVGASRTIPIDEGMAWPPSDEKPDGMAAKQFAEYRRKSHLIHRPDLSFSACGIRFAAVAADGKLRTCRAGLDAAAAELAAFDLPEDVRKEAESVLSGYRAALPAADQNANAESFRRDLYSVSEAAYVLACASSLAKQCAWEAEYEKDGSPLPAELSAITKQLGEWLKKYVSEEVQEELTGGAPADDLAMRAVRAGLISPNEARERSGKVLSSASERSLRECHDHMTRGCDMLKRFIDDALGDDDAEDGEGGEGDSHERAEESQTSGDTSDKDDQEDAERATRARRARALELQLQLN